MIGILFLIYLNLWQRLWLKLGLKLERVDVRARVRFYGKGNIFNSKCKILHQSLD